jgi:hypothetical protein
MEKHNLAIDFELWVERKQDGEFGSGEPVYTTEISIRIDDQDIDDMSDKEFKQYIINKLVERL